MILFKDPFDAGIQLAARLLHYKNAPNTIVLGLPPAGVVGAIQVAQALNLPLDIVVPRKIGAPDQPELAVGAIAQDGTLVWNEDVKQLLGLTGADLSPIMDLEYKEAKRRFNLYRAGRLPLNLKHMTAILVDDGIATGATMRVAIKSARALGAQKIVAAVPLGSQESMGLVAHDADETLCLYTPDFLPAIGTFYERFPQTTDAEVIELLGKVNPH